MKSFIALAFFLFPALAFAGAAQITNVDLLEELATRIDDSRISPREILTHLRLPSAVQAWALPSCVAVVNGISGVTTTVEGQRLFWKNRSDGRAGKIAHMKNEPESVYFGKNHTHFLVLNIANSYGASQEYGVSAYSNAADCEAQKIAFSAQPDRFEKSRPAYICHPEVGKAGFTVALNVLVPSDTYTGKDSLPLVTYVGKKSGKIHAAIDDCLKEAASY